MNKFFIIILCSFLLFAVQMSLLAQDTYQEIQRYDPETDPQVNFPQQMIDAATGVVSEEEGGGGATQAEGQPTVTPAAEGSFAASLVRSAAEHYKRYAVPHSFPYAGPTNNGRSGCAQVVNSILEGIRTDEYPNGLHLFGENPRSGSEAWYNRLRVIQTLDRLRQLGWQEVTPPPYQAGDIIAWNTTGTDDSHIGVVMASGNNVQAISNSSSYGRPRFNPAGPEYAPVTTLLRKVS